MISFNNQENPKSFVFVKRHARFLDATMALSRVVLFSALFSTISVVLSGCVSDNTDNSSEQTIDKAIQITENSLSSQDFLDPLTVARKVKSPVNDFTQTLSSDDIKSLNNKIRSIHDTGLLQIGVVIVPTTGNISIFDYAMALANDWQLGTPEDNNGLLILMALNDKQIYILTGLDTEKKLTDSHVKSVIDNNMTPEFKQQNYATGLRQGIDALVAVMQQ